MCDVMCVCGAMVCDSDGVCAYVYQMCRWCVQWAHLFESHSAIKGAVLVKVRAISSVQHLLCASIKRCVYVSDHDQTWGWDNTVRQGCAITLSFFVVAPSSSSESSPSPLDLSLRRRSLSLLALSRELYPAVKRACRVVSR